MVHFNRAVGDARGVRLSLHTADDARSLTFLTIPLFFFSLNYVAKRTTCLQSARTIPIERQPLVGEVIANFFADRVCHVVSVTDPYGHILGFLDRSRYTFLSSSSSVVLTRLSGLRCRPTIFFLVVPGIEPGPPEL
jgi:hypothetical protein